MDLNRKLQKIVEEFPDRIALIFQDKQITFSQFDRKVGRIAAGMAKIGIGRGDNIGMILPNGLNFVYSFFAITRTGATTVPMNPLLKEDELKYKLNMAEIHFLIMTEAHLPTIEHIIDDLPKLEKFIIVHRQRASLERELPPKLRQRFLTLGDVTQKRPRKTLPPRIDDDDVAEILFTSGTTGKPKGVMLSHGNLDANTDSVIAHYGVTEKDRMVTTLPLCSSYGCTVSMLTPLLAGASIILFPKFNPMKVIENIKKYRATMFPAVPTMFIYLNRLPESVPFDFTSLKCCISGGGPLRFDVQEEFEKRYGVAIYEGDGPTEASPVTSMNPLGGLRKPGSIGRPILNVQMKIVDEEDHQLPTNHVGEIVVKGPNVMKGYYKDPEATSYTLRGGWLHTGDIGKVDHDGYFYIIDRLHDTIIVGGRSVYPKEVEKVLYTHEAVLECAIVGMPDDLLGEVPGGFVVLKNRSDVKEKDLINFCKDRIADFKVPRTVQFRESLPKSLTGKVLRRVLKAGKLN